MAGGRAAGYTQPVSRPDPPPTADPIRPGLWGTLPDPALERRYRADHLAANAATLRLVLGAATAGTLLFVPNDLRQPAELPALLAVRAAFLAGTAAVWWRLGRPIGPVGFDRLATGFSLLFVGFNLALQLLRPPGHLGHAVSTVLVVVLGYGMTPLPPGRLLALGLAHSAGCVLVAARVNPAADPAFVPTLAVALLWGNLLGFAAARLLHARARQVYLALARQTELTARLERALAEVRTLRGLIRVCAWCKGIHADGQWQQLESYFGADGRAQFTHGICPPCLARETGGRQGADSVSRLE